MDILASPCDGIIECRDRSDEIYCSDDTTSHIIIVASIVGVILLYFGLAYRHKIFFCLKAEDSRVKKGDGKKKLTKTVIFQEFQNYHNHSATIKKINNFFFFVIFSQKKERMNQILVEFYDLLENIKKKDEAEVYLYLHSNFDPAIVTAIDKAKFPGLKEKTIGFIEGTTGKKFITKLQDSFTENDRLRKSNSAVQTIRKMVSTQVDLVKDLILTISLLTIMGGPGAIYDFPNRFASVVVLLYAGTIAAPLLLSILQLVVSNPYLIFQFMKGTAAKLNRIIMIMICLALGMFNYALLVFNHEETEEIAISKAKLFTDASDFEVSQLFEECVQLKAEQVEFVKIDLG